MRRVELSKKEIEIIERQLNGKFDPFDANDEDKAVMSGIIDKAESLMNELEAWEESGDDMIKWFYDKFKEQQSA